MLYVFIFKKNLGFDLNNIQIINKTLPQGDQINMAVFSCTL